jgi:hypothetical protein
MESPCHHFLDDRTDAATLDALMRCTNNDLSAVVASDSKHGSNTPIGTSGFFATSAAIPAMYVFAVT